MMEEEDEDEDEDQDEGEDEDEEDLGGDARAPPVDGEGKSQWAVGAT